MKELHRIYDPEKNFDVTKLDQRIDLSKSESKKILKENIEVLDELQQKLYGEAKKSLLVVFQAMDAAGKDSTIRAVFSGMNPQGFLVSSFKVPGRLALAHDYLWRVNKRLPMRGKIGVFNRSHYEEVLVCKVHPQYLLYQDLPDVNAIEDADDIFWQKRYEQINNFEKHLSENGYTIIKFFLNVSRKEQKKRFIDRMNKPHKHWKFSLKDLEERQLWDKYMDAYSSAIRETSKSHAPWYSIPADDKDYMRAAVSEIVKRTMEEMQLEYPAVTDDQLKEIEAAKDILARE
ncbi:MAG: polyphosphate kinase 2 family protein [Flavobacteriales bacterium]|nr:polyphosphate kinase 2 family protein [Flavobacteriales bacterium]